MLITGKQAILFPLLSLHQAVHWVARRLKSLRTVLFLMRKSKRVCLIDRALPLPTRARSERNHEFGDLWVRRSRPALTEIYG